MIATRSAHIANLSRLQCESGSSTSFAAACRARTNQISAMGAVKLSCEDAENLCKVSASLNLRQQGLSGACESIEYARMHCSAFADHHRDRASSISSCVRAARASSVFGRSFSCLNLACLQLEAILQLGSESHQPETPLAASCMTSTASCYQRQLLPCQCLALGVFN